MFFFNIFQQERVLFEVSIEAERIHRIYIENEELDIHNKNFVMISDLLRKIDELREATINVSEVVYFFLKYLMISFSFSFSRLKY